MANSVLSKINGQSGIYSGSGAGHPGELALDHALATDILGKLLREDLGYGCYGWSSVTDVCSGLRLLGKPLSQPLELRV